MTWTEIEPVVERWWQVCKLDLALGPTHFFTVLLQKGDFAKVNDFITHSTPVVSLIKMKRIFWDTLSYLQTIKIKRYSEDNSSPYILKDILEGGNVCSM